MVYRCAPSPRPPAKMTNQERRATCRQVALTNQHLPAPRYGFTLFFRICFGFLFNFFKLNTVEDFKFLTVKAVINDFKEGRRDSQQVTVGPGFFILTAEEDLGPAASTPGSRARDCQSGCSTDSRLFVLGTIVTLGHRDLQRCGCELVGVSRVGGRVHHSKASLMQRRRSAARLLMGGCRG